MSNHSIEEKGPEKLQLAEMCSQCAFVAPVGSLSQKTVSYYSLHQRWELG